MQPRHAHAVADLPTGDRGSNLLDGGDDLMAGRDGEFLRRQVALDDVQVGVAHAAGADVEAEGIRVGS